VSQPEHDPSPPKSQVAYWIFQLTGWGLYTLSRFVGGLTVMHLPWLRFGLELLMVDAIGFGLTHLLRDYVRRRRWRMLPILKLALRIIAAAIVCGIPLGVLTQFTDVSSLQEPNEFLEGVSSPLRLQLALPVAIALEVVNWSVVFMIWQILYFAAIALREHRSAQLKQSETARALHLAELRLLKSQLNPHFLFNALNTVRSLIADNPARAQNAVTHLANTLRYTLSSRQDELVTLAQELEIVADYLQLESMRFEDRLRIEINVQQDAAAVRIPMMLLQTLVENAIKHGIAELPTGGLLSISAGLQNRLFTLEVANPRPAVPDPSAPGPVGAVAHSVMHESVGLRNARDRLRLLFDGRASLDLDLSNATVAIARLQIPVSP
jgi:two-component system sensor histidine kinase AlgZ